MRILSKHVSKQFFIKMMEKGVIFMHIIWPGCKAHLNNDPRRKVPTSDSSPQHSQLLISPMHKLQLILLSLVVIHIGEGNPSTCHSICRNHSFGIKAICTRLKYTTSRGYLLFIESNQRKYNILCRFLPIHTDPTGNNFIVFKHIPFEIPINHRFEYFFTVKISV